MLFHWLQPLRTRFEWQLEQMGVSHRLAPCYARNHRGSHQARKQRIGNQPAPEHHWRPRQRLA